MAIVWHKIKSLNPKKAFLVVGLAGFMALAFSYAFVSATGPQFNIFPIAYTPTVNRDLPLIDARNITQSGGYSVSQADHDNGVDANPGDVIEVSIYYHNGAADSDENIARNVIVKAFSSPSLGSTALSHTLSASISADNATAVFSGSRGGDMKINIQGGVAQSISLVSGSVRLHKDCGITSCTGTALPDTIFTTGVNIGDIRGCFEYHGFVNFRIRVSEHQPVGSLTVDKQVRNVTKSTGYSALVDADPGDTVAYRIVISSVTNTVTGVSARDAMDPRLSLSSSVTLDNNTVSSTAFFSFGITVGTVNVGQNRVIEFQARVASPTSFTVGTHTLPNTVTVYTSAQTVSSEARVRVVIAPAEIVCSMVWNQPHVSSTDDRGLRRVYNTNDPERDTRGRANVNISITGLAANGQFTLLNRHSSGTPEFQSTQTASSSGTYSTFDTTQIESTYTQGDYRVFVRVDGVIRAECKGFRIEAPAVTNIDIQKTARNQNTGEGFANQIQAIPSNRVMFKLEVSPLNSNTALSSVVVRDVLPQKMSYITGTFNVDGVVTAPGNFFSTSGYSLGTIQPGQTRVVTFEVDIASSSNFSIGCEYLINTATVTATGGLTDTDDATVVTCKDDPIKETGTPGSRPSGS